MDYSSLPIFAEADIVVCGGGVAGAFAAKSAADMGKDVLVVEQFGSLGGSATNALVLPLMHSHIPDGRNPQCSYISNIVKEKLEEIGGCIKGGANFDPLLLKAVVEKMCVEAGARVLFHTFIADAVVENSKVTSIVVANKKGLGLIKGKIFIDGTGDGDVCVRAGAEYTKGNPETGKNQPISLRYILSNVDTEKFGQYILRLIETTGKTCDAGYWNGQIYGGCTASDASAFSEVFDEAIANGDLVLEDKAYWQCFPCAARKNCVAFNCPEFFEKIDGTDPDHLTNAQLEGKQAVLRHLNFYKKYFDGFEDAYISEIAPMVGIRESRNIITEYVLKAEDLLARRKFDDMFSQSNYPVDVHGWKLKCERHSDEADDGKPWYEIPYKTLVVKGFDNLFITGRCLGAEFIAQSSLRIQPCARASGEAAGIAAALCVENNVCPRDINGKTVREIMISKGAEFI